jgi:hypothetical protein
VQKITERVELPVLEDGLVKIPHLPSEKLLNILVALPLHIQQYFIGSSGDEDYSHEDAQT